MLEDIDSIIRQELKTMSQIDQGPVKKQLAYNKDQPLLQYFEESDPKRKQELKNKGTLKLEISKPLNSTTSSLISGFSEFDYQKDKEFPTSIRLDFKPLVIKQLSGVWLLVAGQD